MRNLAVREHMNIRNFYLPNTFESVAKMVPAYAISAGAVIGNGARNYSVRDAALSTVILQDSLR